MKFSIKQHIHTIFQKSVILIGLSAIFCASTFLLASCQKAPITWITDYDTAIILAQEKNKNIFLIFTGLAWDSISETLKSDILYTEKFMQDVGNDYILLHIDIPKIYETSTQQDAMKNYELAQSMSIPSFPTAVLLTQTEQIFAFLPITANLKLPTDLIDLVDTKRANAKKITSAYKKLKKSEGIGRAKAIDNYIDSIPAQFVPPALYEELVELDPENKTNLLGKYKLLLAHVVASKAYSMGDPETAVNSFLVLIDEPNLLTPLETQNAYYGIVYYGTQGGLIPEEEGIAYLKQAYNVAPDSDDAPYYLMLIDELGEANAP